MAVELDPLVILVPWASKDCKVHLVFKVSEVQQEPQVIKALQVQVAALRDPQV